MFTGLVEDRGTVIQLRSQRAGMWLEIEVGQSLLGEPPGGITAGACTQIGDSIAINGCCLTVVAIEGNRFSFEAGPETLAKTNLGTLAVGDAVNLERALPAQGRLGGHFVQGHVDGTGQIDALDRTGEWVTVWVRLSPELACQLVPKGSVTVDGISLTVVDVEPERFSVALIPHTLEVTNLGTRRVGDIVNIETDILGKYVRRFLSIQTPE